MRTLAVCLLALPLAAAERSPQLRPPVIGYVVDGGSVRALWGVPGASRWSDPIALPADVTDVAAAPGGWLLGRQGERLVSIALDGVAAGEATPVDGSSSDADLFAFSPSGAAAVAYSTRSGRVQVIVEGRVAWESFAAANAIAVNDDGSAVAAAGQGITLLRSGLQPRALSNSRAAALAFASGRDELYAVAGGELQVFEQATIRGQLRVAARDDAFAGARSLIVSGDSIWIAGTKLWSVDRDGTVTASDVDPAGAAASRFAGAVITRAGLAGEVR